MEPYAVVETGGKQYLLKVNDKVRVERLATEAGKQVDLSPVLAVSDGTKLQVGQPAVQGSVVTASVVEHILGPKVRSFKKRRRKGYAKHIGHRQQLTVLKVESIQ